MKRRIIIYLAGMAILALGITLNTKTGLGVTPIIGPPFAVQEITGMKLGNIVFIWYIIFLLIEMAVHFSLGTIRTMREFGIEALQLPVSLLFTRLMNLYGSVLPDFAVDYAGSFAGSTAGRILVILVAVTLTGVGAAMTMDVRLVPNPADGLVQALADLTGKESGLVRNFFDLTCVLIATVISLTAGKGFTKGIGIGTLIAALGTGRVIAWYHTLIKRI